jgi:hypothetical protein
VFDGRRVHTDMLVRQTQPGTPGCPLDVTRALPAVPPTSFMHKRHDMSTSKACIVPFMHAGVLVHQMQRAATLHPLDLTCALPAVEPPPSCVFCACGRAGLLDVSHCPPAAPPWPPGMRPHYLVLTLPLSPSRSLSFALPPTQNGSRNGENGQMWVRARTREKRRGRMRVRRRKRGR